ncbi:DNA polymerase III subunit delta' (plasmid) [Rossellomorea sp. AcN35-11]|nr:DNA polymerase III subunit delta' [Rossellomorea aquimaris]WJV32391.1 DNA polymerase III subunit delta' [Rossellomorea sp. AcN35-11]
MSWNKIEDKQPKVTRIVKNSITNDRISHGYLFKGGKGVGKEEIAIHFIKRFFCKSPNGAEPCGVCEHCKRIKSENVHPDFHIVRPDGNSIKIDQIRELQKEFNWKSVEGEKKAYLIVDAEKMTTQSANGLLKFLEEPSQNTLAILLTTQPQRILTTIKSRCQEIAFQPLKSSALVEELESEGVDKTLGMVVSQLTNDFEKATELVNDEWFLKSLSIVKQLTNEIYNNPDNAVFMVQGEWIKHFKEKEQQHMGLELLLLWYRDIQMYQLDKELIFVNEKVQIEIQNIELATLYEIMNDVIQAKGKLYSNSNHQMVMEQLVFSITSKVL